MHLRLRLETTGLLVVQATLEWENQDDGFLAKILVGDGSKDIPVGTPVAVITDEKDDVSQQFS